MALSVGDPWEDFCFLQLPENFRNCGITGIELMSNFMLFAFVFNSVLDFPEVLGFV